MSGNAEEMLTSIQLPYRFSKPRESGLTVITDDGIPLSSVKSTLKSFANYIDKVKLFAGTAFLDSQIAERIELYRQFDIEPYFGGALFEKYYQQSNLDGYRTLLKKLQVEVVELMDIGINIPIERRLELISQFAADFRVIGKIGGKDSQTIVSPMTWVRQMKSYLEAGCEFVLAAGTTGKAGLFRSNGEIRQGLVADIVASVPEQKLIFDAPNRYSQGYFVKLLGPNANLSHVDPRNLLTLESLRCGMLDETLFIE